MILACSPDAGAYREYQECSRGVQRPVARHLIADLCVLSGVRIEFERRIALR